MAEDIIEEVFAGVIPFRKREDEVEYLLVSYKKGYWSFPEGPAEADEKISAAALRQLEEETSIPAEKVILKLEEKEKIEYTFEKDGNQHRRTVYLYPGEIDPSAEVEISSDLKDYWWLSFDEAVVQMTYPEPRRVLEDFHQEKHGEARNEPLIDTSLLDED